MNENHIYRNTYMLKLHQHNLLVNWKLRCVKWKPGTLHKANNEKNSLFLSNLFY